MVRDGKAEKGLFSQLDRQKMGGKEPVTDAIAIVVEYMKYQGEVAYEVGKKQALALTSTVSTMSIGWSIFFFGIMQESWLSSSVGLMMVFAATYLLGYWTPRVLDKVRSGLDAAGAARFYEKWLADRVNAEAAEKVG